MNKLWDDLKDNMKEWGASAVEKAEEISRVAVAKGEEFTKISKIRIEIMQIEKEVAKVVEQGTDAMSGLILQHLEEAKEAREKGEEQRDELLEKIKEGEEQRDELLEKIEELSGQEGLVETLKKTVTGSLAAGVDGTKSLAGF